MYRWIQLSTAHSEELEKQGLVTKNSGYKYKNRDGINMVEYHVDSNKIFQEEADKETRFGGYREATHYFWT